MKVDTRRHGDVNDEKNPEDFDHSINNSKSLYIITEKKYTKRHWEEKFQDKPEIPVKVVNFIRKSSKSPFREDKKQSPVQISDLSKLQLTSSHYFTSNSSTKVSKNQVLNDGATEISITDFNGSYNNKNMPYFQYSLNRLKKNPSGRSQSPTIGREVSLKELIDSEILNLSKNKMSSSKAFEFQSSPKSIFNRSDFNSSAKFEDSLISASTIYLEPSPKSKSSKPKAIIDDASKRYRLPKKMTKPQTTLLKKETENMKQRYR